MKRKYWKVCLLLVFFLAAHLFWKILNYIYPESDVEKAALKMNHDHSQMNHDHGHMNHDHSKAMYHDHGTEGDGTEADMGCPSMHSMVFHTGVCQEILFPGWTSTTAGQMVGACVVVFLAGLLYEGLKAWRDLIFNRGSASAQASTSQVNITKQECGPDGNCSGQKIVRYPMLSTMHTVQTILHMLQVFFSYLLMLIFMTYNIWLCLALVLGTGLGYFLFAWRKQSVVDLTEHCQ